MSETAFSIDAAKGCRLSYRVQRAAKRDHPVLVLIHGLASNMTRWTEFVQTTTLQHDWDILRFDLRGHGDTMRCADFTHEVWCEDLHTILAAESFTQAVIVGHSLGAQVAINFAQRYPGKCAGLVLIDPVFPDALQGKLATVSKFRGALRMLIGLVKFCNALGLKRRKVEKLDLYHFDQQTRALLASSSDKQISEIYADPFLDIKHLPTANYLQDMYEVTRPLPPLGAITCPVLVMLSAGADLADIEQNKRHAALFPKGAIEIVECDHWMLTEKPAESRAIIEAWCRKLVGE
ncbi:MAG: alpha/beta hydrolase [Pseudomonadota bacterium]